MNTLACNVRRTMGIVAFTSTSSIIYSQQSFMIITGGACQVVALVIKNEDELYSFVKKK